MTLTPAQLSWCREHLRIGNIFIFRIMESTRTVRVR